MQRETALAVAGLALLVVSIVAVLAVPGAMVEQRESDRPSVVELRSDAPPDVLSVTGDAVTLQVDTRLVHRGGPAENVSLELRAVDTETGLLEDRIFRDVGTIEDDEERRVLSNLTLAREGGYRVETILYADGRRIESGQRSISGVGTLTPAYARSSIQFQRFEGAGSGLPTITYGVANVSDDSARLRVSAALVNTGSEPDGDVTLQVRARQADSNVIADSTSIEVDDIRPGRTAFPSAELTVPDGYNYWLDAMIVADGVVVGTATEAANLDPSETLEPNRTTRDVAFESGDFEREETESGERAPRSPRPTEEEGPGFGIAVAIAAVVAAIAVALRGRNR